MKKYNFGKYDTESRWMSYWHQINQVLKLNPKNVLEIGAGNKTVSDYLKNAGIQVSVLDSDKELKPDIVASVLRMPFTDNSFDLVLCCEVLEHLPFEKFEKCLKEIKRVSRKDIIISLPHFGPQIRFCSKIPLFKEVKFALKIPFAKKHQFNGEHFWEIGKKGYSLAEVKKTISRYFNIKRDFVPFEHQYHHFFILEK